MSHIRAVAEVPPKASTIFSTSSLSMSRIVGQSNFGGNRGSEKKLSWHERLAILIEASDINQSGLARICGVSSPTVTDWLNGKIKMLGADHLICICQVFRVNPVWMITGRGDKRMFEQRTGERRMKERRTYG